MKKRFYFAILVLFACALCMVGCGTKAEYKADSLTYTIEDRERVQGSFSYTIESGTAIGINYTVVGYDEYGEELWTSSLGDILDELEPREEPYTEYFTFAMDLPAFSNAVVRIEITDLTFQWGGVAQGNDLVFWAIGVGAGLLVAGAIALLIVFFVREKVKEKKE